MNSISVLCVDDDHYIVDALALILKNAGYKVFTALSGKKGLSIIEKEHIDIAIIDYKMPGMDGLELLKKIKNRHSGTDVLMLTGHGSIPTAVEAIKEGAHDYILKPFLKSDLLIRLDKLKKLRELQQENVQLKAHLKDKYQFKNLIGTTEGMVRIFKMISNIAESDSTVLIQGETGTGKEEIAKAIHFSGSRSDLIFNTVDCASINPNLIESELFGHVKGAFTGADSDKAGLISATRRGTLFLDEIGEIPINIQVKLLRAIQEHVIRPVGSVKPVKFDSRIITATSRDLEEAIEKNEFRQDLYFRLNVVTIRIPPLRERTDDIPLLLEHFIQKHKRKSTGIKGFSQEVMDIFNKYHWPGNVRELENCIERAYTIGIKGKIGINDIPERIITHARGKKAIRDISKKSIVKQEEELIRNVLIETNGNKRKTARILKIGVATLYRKLKKYNIE